MPNEEQGLCPEIYSEISDLEQLEQVDEEFHNMPLAQSRYEEATRQVVFKNIYEADQV